MSVKKVSVIVPSYNYEEYIEKRIRSILEQSYPIHELIILDDASTDRSVEIIRRVIAEADIPVRLVVNEKNSGSVFHQWMKGIGLASGDYIWIAEADDSCDRRFLAEVMRGFADPEVVLSYTMSALIKEDGTLDRESAKHYTDDIDPERWQEEYTRSGIDEIRDTLVVHNTIPNVSAVAFKKMDFGEIEKDIQSFRVAGDWYMYAWILQFGKIRYWPEPLNYWRQHPESVSGSTRNNRIHYWEILRVQRWIYERFSVPLERWEKALQFREKKKLWFKIYHPGIEKYLFIITYGESGSERLMGMLNAQKGVEIRGENMNLLYTLYQSFLSMRRAKRHAGKETDRKDHPWFGVNVLEPLAFAHKLCALFVTDVLKPSEDTRVSGFKEIRLLGEPFEKVKYYVLFLLNFFPDSFVVFYRSDPEEVVKRGWMAKQDRNELLQKIKSFEKAMMKLQVENRERVMLLDHREILEKGRLPERLMEFVRKAGAGEA